jgi:hypothetical protein
MGSRTSANPQSQLIPHISTWFHLIPLTSTSRPRGGCVLEHRSHHKTRPSSPHFALQKGPVFNPVSIPFNQGQSRSIKANQGQSRQKMICCVSKCHGPVRSQESVGCYENSVERVQFPRPETI